MTDWFTSDPHFGHRRILEFCPRTRPFKNADEMDRAMLEMWKAQVQPDDTLRILGDVSWHPPKRIVSILKEIPCRKHLIWGNHDYDAHFESNFDFLDCFEWVGDSAHLVMDGIDVHLYHYPIAEWHKAHRGGIHFHGHTHGNVVLPGRALDVGIDGPLGTGDCRLYSWQECKAYCMARPLPSKS